VRLDTYAIANRLDELVAEQGADATSTPAKAL
jgi:hypothetical protein